jgi:hypothetical protein
MNNTLAKQIENNIQEAIREFAERISERYGLDTIEIMKLWECSKTGNDKKQTIEKNNIVTKPISIPQKEIPEKVLDKKPSVAKSDTSSCSSGEGCPYLFIKGAREGEYCGSRPKNGAVYCSRHKKYEGTEPKQKKVLPTSKKSISEVVKSKKVSPRKEINIVLRKHKILCQLWHQDTGMVFRSAKERVVIGKAVSDVLKPLDNDDIEICKAHGFKYEIEPNNEEKENKTTSVIEKSNPEEDLSDEDILKDEDVISSISHKITAVPSNLDKTQKSSAVVQDKVSISSTKTLSASNATAVKKSISAAIATTNVQAKNVTKILGSLQGPSKEYDDQEEDIENIIGKIKKDESCKNEEFSEEEEEEVSDEEYEQEIASDDELMSESD